MIEMNGVRLDLGMMDNFPAIHDNWFPATCRDIAHCKPQVFNILTEKPVVGSDLVSGGCETDVVQGIAKVELEARYWPAEYRDYDCYVVEIMDEATARFEIGDDWRDKVDEDEYRGLVLVAVPKQEDRR